MCDYSLDNVQSRPAEVGDKLVTTQFRNTITRGFSAVDHPCVAVCLRPGTEIAFEGKVRTGWGENLLSFFNKRDRLIPDGLARFRLIDLDDPSTHHDALEFSDGQIILLTRLRLGQRARVLQLPAELRTVAEERGQASTTEGRVSDGHLAG